MAEGGDVLQPGPVVDAHERSPRNFDPMRIGSYGEDATEPTWGMRQSGKEMLKRAMKHDESWKGTDRFKQEIDAEEVEWKAREKPQLIKDTAESVKRADAAVAHSKASQEQAQRDIANIPKPKRRRR
jgi:hypothetical protein